MPEANAPDRVADSPAREREGDKEPRHAAPACAQRSHEARDRGAPQQPIVDPVIKEAVDAPASQPKALVGGVKWGTEEEVRKTSARLVKEPSQGFGHATRRGLVEATGELIVLAEPDGTFVPEDISKLLVYGTECDAVFATRTTWELVWEGANMDWFLRWGNWAVAKLIEVLFNTSHLSDVGCTYRLLRRDTARCVASGMKVGGSHAGGDHAAHDPLRCAVRRGAGQLSPARRTVICHRQPVDGDLRGTTDDRPGASRRGILSPTAHTTPGVRLRAHVERRGGP